MTEKGPNKKAMMPLLIKYIVFVLFIVSWFIICFLVYDGINSLANDNFNDQHHRLTTTKGWSGCFSIFKFLNLLISFLLLQSRVEFFKKNNSAFIYSNHTNGRLGWRY